MSHTGDFWHNAVAERFIGTREHELLAEHSWALQARRAILEFMKDWNN